MKAWIGLGSNLGQPVKQLKKALRRLASLDHVELLRLSSFYRTPPWGYEQQSDFFNAVAVVDTSLKPVSLLHGLQSIENIMGRRRSGLRWGPRVIDLDLLIFEGLLLQSDELVVPHPRIHERAFVLVPVCELDAALEIPGQGLSGELMHKLDCRDIIRLDSEFTIEDT